MHTTAKEKQPSEDIARTYDHSFFATSDMAIDRQAPGATLVPAPVQPIPSRVGLALWGALLCDAGGAWGEHRRGRGWWAVLTDMWKNANQ